MTDLVGAWQAALAAEQRARFGYGVLGPRLGAGSAAAARVAQGGHEQLISDTGAAMAAAGITPHPPAADYPDLYPVTSAGVALRLAVRLEEDAAAAWRFAYAAAAGTGSLATGATNGAAGSSTLERIVRALAQRALTDSAVRATRWRLSGHLGTPSVPFPGI